MNPLLRILRNAVWLIGLSALICSLAGAGWSLYGRHEEQTAAQAVGPSTPPDDGAVAVVIGHVDTRQGGPQALHPVVAGRVEEVKARDGQRVRAGELLLSLDKELARLQVSKAQAGLSEARLILEKARRGVAQQQLAEQTQQEVIEAARRSVEAAERRLARAEELWKARREGDTAGNEVLALRAEVQAAQAKVRVAERDLDRLRANDPTIDVRRAENDLAMRQLVLAEAEKGLRECDLLAPTDGTVVQVNVGRGDVVSSASRQPAILFLADEPLIVRAELDQESAARVQKGMKAVIEDDTRAKGEWHGTVDWIADTYTHKRSVMLNPLAGSDSRILECVVTLDPGRAPPRHGQRMRVRLYKTTAR